MYPLINRFAREIFHGHLTRNQCVTIMHCMSLKTLNKSVEPNLYLWLMKSLHLLTPCNARNLTRNNIYYLCS